LHLSGIHSFFLLIVGEMFYIKILYFLRLYNEFFIILDNILKIAELDCCQIIILSIYVPSTHAYAHVLRLSLDLHYEKR
jgi:hypothetical protein